MSAWSQVKKVLEANGIHIQSVILHESGNRVDVVRMILVVPTVAPSLCTVTTTGNFASGSITGTVFPPSQIAPPDAPQPPGPAYREQREFCKYLGSARSERGTR
jgi:hypothetical protein